MNCIHAPWRGAPHVLPAVVNMTMPIAGASGTRASPVQTSLHHGNAPSAGLQTNKRHRFISKGAEHEFSRPSEMTSTHSGVPRNASVLADTEAAVAATFGRDLERAVAQLASNASALLDSALGRLPDVAAQVRAACQCRRSFYDDPSFFIYCVLPPACSRACRGKEGSSCV